MPMITFEAGQLHSEVKAKLLERLTEVSAEITGIPNELYFVSIREVPDTDIAVGGETVADLKKRISNK